MDLQSVKGIGAKYAQLLNKLDVYTAEDLLEFFPRGYIRFEEPVCILEAASKDGNVAVYLCIRDNVHMNRVRNMTILSVQAEDEQGSRIALTWFNMPFLKTALKKGTRYIFYGKIIKKGNGYAMEQPHMYTPAAYSELKGSLQPIYPLTKGLSGKNISKAVKNAFSVITDINDCFSESFKSKHGLIEYKKALYDMHFPENTDMLKAARKRLVFQEFFMFILSMGRFKSTANTKSEFYIDESPITREFIGRLDYGLTNGQKEAYAQICSDMESNRTMNRLVQGDVGCGKTIVALLALMNTIYSGYQGAMMVPTEVLAKQQYESTVRLFKENGINIKVELLTGSMTPKEKKYVYEGMADGTAQLIIGTHALIQEKAVYKDLALVVTDEQHRFGVNQRETLYQKGRKPHVLVMSATPIPRTLAIILYGDLDISLIKELPAKRLPIKNCVVDRSYRKNAYEFITKEADKGHQAYVICPMVEESETTEAENVTDYVEKLRCELPERIRCEYLHGRMSGEEKQHIMQEFADNKIQVLVSTTVIEVGVNVPNATVMLIEDANRFGLSQLHQLRGRVGRGDAQSYCIFLASSLNDETRARLDIIGHSNDGFKIAEEDLKLRGPGEMFGVRQSGAFSFKLGDIYEDSMLLKEAAEAAKQLLTADPELKMPENANIAVQIEHMTNQMKIR